MLRQLAVGAGVGLANIALHAVATIVVIGVARAAAAWSDRHARAWLIAVMTLTVGMLMLAHVAEVMAWALAYHVLRVVPAGADALYFALVNYTTLGYGDVLPAARWRLLGPAAAMNGILLFGWSTAVIFEVLRRALGIQDGRRASAADHAPAAARGRSSAGRHD